MNHDEHSAPPTKVWPPGHAGAALRGLVAQVAAGTTGPVYIGEDGQPQAVLLSYAAYRELLDLLDNADAALTVQSRLATTPPPGQGLSTEELIAQVAAEDPDLAADMRSQHPDDAG